MSGKVGKKNVEVLRDGECNWVIVKKELVDEADFTGKFGYMMTVNRTLLRAHIASFEIDYAILHWNCRGYVREGSSVRLNYWKCSGSLKAEWSKSKMGSSSRRSYQNTSTGT